MNNNLPPLPDQHVEAYEWTSEIYQSMRMQLAALPEPLLRQVCSTAPGAEDMLAVLAPLRAVRPMNGGPGWNEELGVQLRQLNFEL